MPGMQLWEYVEQHNVYLGGVCFDRTERHHFIKIPFEAPTAGMLITDRYSQSWNSYILQIIEGLVCILMCSYN